MFGGKFRVSKRTARTVLAWGFVVMGVLMVNVASPLVAFAQDFNAGNGVVSLIGSILATFIDTIANTLGSITLVVIKSTVINILNYNNFTGSSIVNLGWTLVRDMVNMFAVIVLLIMAVKTIISNSSGAWQQQIPRFFLGIVFANFSRTLVGLAIDASQIVMMTFVNAIMGIAAGNFAQLLVMPQTTSFSLATFQSAQTEATQLLTVAANIANAYAKLLVQVIVLVVMILLAVGFIWRIVSLWFVLIMAPMAGFSWGAMEIVKFLATFYNQWVAKAVPPLLWGPLTAFFLYLALAVSSNGNLAKAEAFPEPDSEVIPGQVKLEVFESTNFTGLLIAVVFLILGIQESAKISSKMGGLAARAINDKTFGRALRIGRTVSGRVVGAPVTAARLGTQLTAAGLGVMGYEGGKKFVNKWATTPLQALESPIESSRRGGKFAAGKAERALSALGMATGIDAFSTAGSAIDAQLHELDEKSKKAAKDRVAHMTDEQKVARLIASVNGTGEITQDKLADAKILRGEIFTNKKFAESLKGEVGDGEFEKIIEDTLHTFDHDESHRPIDKDAWNKARSQYVDLYAKAGGNARGFIDSEDFNGRLMRAKAGANKDIIAALGAASSGKVENGRVIMKLDEFNRGNYGSGKMAEATKYMSREDITPSATATPEERAAAADRIKAMVEGGVNVDALADQEIKAEANTAAREGRAPRFTSATVKQEFVAQVMNTQEVEDIIKSFDKGQYDESHLRDAMFSARNANADRAVQAMARTQNVDFSKMNPATRDQINLQLATMEAAKDRISADDANEIRKKLVAAGKTVSDVITGVDPNPVTNPAMKLSGNERLKTQQLFKADPSTINQVRDAVVQATISGGRNDFTKTIVEGLSKEDFTKLSDMMRKETDAARKAAIKNAMSTINQALNIHERTAASPDEVKRLKGLRSAYSAADRYMT